MRASATKTPTPLSLRSRDQPCRLRFWPSRWRRIQILVSNTCLGEIRSDEPSTSSEEGVAILLRSSSAHHRWIRKNTREHLRRAGPRITHGTASDAETTGTHRIRPALERICSAWRSTFCGCVSPAEQIEQDGVVPVPGVQQSLKQALVWCVRHSHRGNHFNSPLIRLPITSRAAFSETR
jgi:hypothetical protein